MDADFLWRALFRPLLLSATYIAVMASACYSRSSRNNNKNREEIIDAEYEQHED